ncbi:NAD(P)H-binding protein [Spirulina major]|uniref:NAD(P)H-binding protein n=1 Tax=Spirulina major TaxID=270636 RepID=UPI00093474B3|nr:NAD(P)H-binding protein [Spirulina major]
MKAFVAGATGRTGRQIVQVLLEKDIAVCALVRSLEKGQTELPQGVELVEGDLLNPPSWQAALADCDVVFCAVGAAPSLNFTEPYQVDYVGTKHLIDATEKQGIERFILISSLCVSQFFHPLNLFWLVLFWKQQVEQYLQKTGLKFTIVRPGGLLDTDNADPLVVAQADTLFEGRIPRRKVAELAVESLFYDDSQYKVIETVAQPEAQPQSWEHLFRTLAA